MSKNVGQDSVSGIVHTYNSSTKVEYTTDIRLGTIVRLKSYRVQRKKVQKVFGFHSYYSYRFFRLSVFKVLLDYFIHSKVL
jgi:hypothetical protein